MVERQWREERPSAAFPHLQMKLGARANSGLPPNDLLALPAKPNFPLTAPCLVPRKLRRVPRRGAAFWREQHSHSRGLLRVDRLTAAWAREVQAAAPGWECSPRARHLCCTTYAVPVPVSSARSDRHMPHRSPGFKHPLANASPPLKRTRTASCAFHSSSASQSSWPPAHRAWESTAETTDVVWADHP